PLGKATAGPWRSFATPTRVAGCPCSARTPRNCTTYVSRPLTSAGPIAAPWNVCDGDALARPREEPGDLGQGQAQGCGALRGPYQFLRGRRLQRCVPRKILFDGR